VFGFAECPSLTSLQQLLPFTSVINAYDAASEAYDTASEVYDTASEVYDTASDAYDSADIYESYSAVDFLKYVLPKKPLFRDVAAFVERHMTSMFSERQELTIEGLTLSTFFEDGDLQIHVQFDWATFQSGDVILESVVDVLDSFVALLGENEIVALVIGVDTPLTEAFAGLSVIEFSAGMSLEVMLTVDIFALIAGESSVVSLQLLDLASNVNVTMPPYDGELNFDPVTVQMSNATASFIMEARLNGTAAESFDLYSSDHPNIITNLQAVWDNLEWTGILKSRLMQTFQMNIKSF
jgi:hypothetical protein